MSQITTHVLDTAKGKPARGIEVTLQHQTSSGTWTDRATGRTDDDGRVSNLLNGDKRLDKGIYRMVFITEPYFIIDKITAFYPMVIVVFNVTDDSHYHIPLLLSPFGYSTYRGS